MKIPHSKFAPCLAVLLPALVPSAHVLAAETAPAPPVAASPFMSLADQGGNYPGENKEARRARLLANYEHVLTDLTPNQKTRILTVLEPASDAMKAARTNPQLTPDQQHGAMMKVHSDVALKIDPILTPGQLTKWREARQDRIMQRREKAAAVRLSAAVSPAATVAVAALTGPKDPDGAGNPQADPAAYALLKAAHDARQVLPASYPGFTADVTFTEDGKSFEGKLVYRRQGKTDITFAGLTPDQKSWVEDKLINLLGHRRGGDFALEDGRNPLSFGKAGENYFGKLIELHDGVQSSYRVKDNRVLEVTRVAGGMRFTISAMETMPADAGKYLANHFTVAYRDAKTGVLQEFEGYRDSYARFDGAWLPVLRFVYEFGEAATPAVRTLRLGNHKVLDAAAEGANEEPK